MNDFFNENTLQRRSNVELLKESSNTLLKWDEYRDFNTLIEPYLNVKELTNEQCFSLYKKAKSGDIEAKEKLVSSFYKIAYQIIVKKYYKSKFHRIDDLFQEAMFGIYEAIDEWDKHESYTLINLVKVKIKNKLFKYVINGYSVFLSKNICEQLYELYKLEDDFVNEKKYKPSSEELSSFSNGKYSVDKINDLKIISDSCKCASLDMPIDEEGNDLYDVLPDKTVNEIERINDKSTNDLISKIINEDLTPNESEAFVKYYGLYGEEELNYLQIANSMGVKPSTVCNYVLEARSKINIILESRYGIASKDL